MQTNQTVRILLAEDVLTDAEIVKREILKFLPQAVFEWVQTGEDFQQALGQFKPDLILSDYNMPAFTGLDALKITLDVCPDIPLIIVTGSINEETAVDCIKAGAVDYVLKESLKRLGPAVMQALDQKEVKVQRLLAEERLRESEERFRRLAENAQDMIYRFELFPHIQCTYMSPASLHITGYAPEEYYADPDLVFKYVHPEDMPVLKRMIFEEENIRTPITLRYIRKDGALIWKEQRNIPIFDDTGKLVAMEGIARDVTQQKQNEQKLLQSDRVFNYSVDMFCVAGFDGYFKVLNPAWERTLGWSIAELLSKPWNEFVHPDDREKTKNIKAVIVEGNEVFRFENRYLCKDGSIKWLSWNVYPFSKENIMIGATRDITANKEAEEKLRESEERYRSFVENSLDAILLTKPTGEILSANPAACKMFGMAEDEILDSGRGGIVDLSDPRLSVLLKQREELGKAEGELYFKRKDGSRFLCEITSALFRDSTGETKTSMIIRDITERKKQEEALRENEEKFRSLFNDHSAIKLLINPDSKNIEDANKAAADFYGYPVEELKRMKITDINMLSEEKLNAQMQRALSVRNISFEFKHRKADGSVCDVEVFSSKVTVGGKLYLHSIIHDITEKKRNERQLRLLNRAVEQSPVTMFITDKAGCIEYVNPTFTRITGYTQDEITGKKANVLKSGIHTAAFYKELWDTILSGKDWKGELQNKKKDGTLYWVSVVISPIFNNEGEITHFVTVREDITDRKKMIEDLFAAKEKAEESDRLKSAFLANMSHEIRTPMNSIIGFLDLLQEPELEDELREDYLQIVQESSDRLLNTINDIIEISKIEAGHIEVKEESVQVNGVLNYFYEFFKPEAWRNGLELRVVNLLPEDAQIKTDKNKLESILGNLMKNAIKFTANGFVELGCQPDNGQLVFYVKDSGIGIAPNRLEAIFDRFTQADLKLNRTYEGSGLGLSICKSYAELLKGRIWVESEVGQGSTFFVSIPVDVQSEINQQTPEAVAEAVADEQPEAVILIAEDDQASYYYLEVVLAKQNYQLIRARNGEEAIQLVQQHPEIQLVLMDIKMPVMDGYEATRQIRQFNTRVPIIAQTAFALSGDRERTEQCGFTDYLAKPIKAADLVALIERYTL
ncbi:MAG: PAS domain S-box protein [Mangrovibacterium sp.]